MRKILLTSLSLMLFAVVALQSSTAFAQRQTCALELKIIEPNKEETDELKVINNARAIIMKVGSRKSIPADTVEGQPIFPELADGDYKITITKRGFKRTIQPLSFMCIAPSQDSLIYIKLERGSTSQTVTSEKLSVNAGAVIGTTDVTVHPVSPPPAVVLPPTKSTQVISGGVLNDKAVSLPPPEYPAIARTAKASGTVTVQVMIDEEGNVISASAVNGHPLLRAAAVEAAREAKFMPTILSGQPVKVSGIINYEFVLPPPGEPRAVTE